VNEKLMFLMRFLWSGRSAVTNLNRRHLQTSLKSPARCPEKKNMKRLIVLVLLASTLTGCAVYTPSGAVVVDPHGGGGGGGGGFCPPGQAKKGNC
jgi:hypothetical protein